MINEKYKFIATGVIVAALLAGVPTADAAPSSARELHVSPHGDDNNPGTKGKPFKTIQKAAQRKVPPKFYKTNPPNDSKYFNNKEKKNYDGGVAGLQDADYPGGKVFKTGPSIQDEEDAWHP